jgi:hypothetical protein
MNQALGLFCWLIVRANNFWCIAFAGSHGCVGEIAAGLRFISAQRNMTRLQREKRQQDKQTLAEFQANEATVAWPKAKKLLVVFGSAVGRCAVAKSSQRLSGYNGTFRVPCGRGFSG